MNKELNKDIKELIQMEHTYPEPQDEEFQKKIYEKREFYYHKVPHRKILNNYEDIKAYRDDYCTGSFKLFSQQSFLSNFINPDTPYRGVLIYHGVGTGKCIDYNELVKLKNTEKKIGEIWDECDDNILYDKENCEWKNANITVKSYDILNNKYVDGEVVRLYRQHINEKMKEVILENGLKIKITQIHPLLTINGWSNVFKVNDLIAFNKNNIVEYCKIKSINYYYFSGYVYDLEVKNYHNFIANNIVVHNTCAAIAIAERFKEMVKKYNTKIYVLVHGPLIKEHWKSEIVKCTKETYLKDVSNKIGYINKTDVERAKKNAINLAMQYYKVISYRSFYKKVLGEKVIEKRTNDQSKKIKISYRRTEEGKLLRDIAIDKIDSLDNTIIIVDEAHHLTGNEQGEALRKIIKASKNLRVILVTATPMKNLADDVVELLNFLRPQNDQIMRDKIFNTPKYKYQLDFKKGGQEYLKKMANGYISHFRGANPLLFAKQVDMGEIPDGLIFTKVVKCEMSKFQYEMYVKTAKETSDALERKSEAVANFVFPGLSDDRKSIVGYSGREGINTVILQLDNYPEILLNLINKRFFNGKIKDTERLIHESEKTKSLTGLILKFENIKYFSTKFYEILKNLSNLVVGKGGLGIAFIYSNLVKIGIELFQETLIVNGYLEYNENSNYVIRDNTKCYYCGNDFSDHDKSHKYPHEFHPATFISITGKTDDQIEILPETKKKILDNVYNNIENKEGKFIKFVLGSKVMTEGITLENVKEVHILDVHHNLSKIHQAVGRAIRQCKHYNITNDENPYPEVKVYKYVVKVKDILSTEEKLYKKAELKYVLIKKVERLLKEVSIDCPVNYHGNIFPEELENYKKCANVEEYLKDKSKTLCPARCDFEKCKFKCHDKKLNLDYYDKDRTLYKKIPKDNLDYTTFTHTLARNEIDYAKEKIKELYKLKYVYLLDEIIEYIKNSYHGEKKDLFDEFFVFKGLDELIPISENDFNNFKDTILDKYNVPGYLIYRNKFYIFQPFEQNEDVPMYYRSTFNKELLNELSLFTYMKGTDVYAKVKSMLKKIEEFNDEPDEYKYDFESGYDYYDNKEEYKYVCIIDKARKRVDTSYKNMKDIFKIRLKRSKILEKKRGTGIPSMKGAVCETSKDKNHLIKIAKTIGATLPKNGKTRKHICDSIKNKLMYMEKYSTDAKKNKFTYAIIPYNHKIYPFPYNLEDRTRLIIKKINDLLGTVIIKKAIGNKGIFNEKRDKEYTRYMLSFNDNPEYTQHKNKIEKIGFKLGKKKWQIIIE